MDSSCILIVSILEGRNFEIPEGCEVSGEEYHLLFEARFNEEILTSDPIAISASSPTVRPEIYTELAWQLSKRSLHQFRVERRPIKLQCFLVRSSPGNERVFSSPGNERVFSSLGNERVFSSPGNERVFTGNERVLIGNEKVLIGYLVIDLRTAQDSEEPKYEWKPLLNTKYRATSKTRPEIQIALHLTKCPDENNALSSQENPIQGIHDYRSPGNGEEFPENRKEFPEFKLTQVDTDQKNGHSGQTSPKVVEIEEDGDYEYDIQVKEVDGWFKIWDSQKSSPSPTVHYNLSVVIVSAEELSSLVSRSLSCPSSYHFKFTLLGKTIRTKSFKVSSGPIDLPVEKVTFKVAASDLDILKKYFELNPSFQICFCSSSNHSPSSEVIASVSIPLTNLYIHTNGPSPVVGEFNLNPNHVQGDHDNDTEAVIGVYVALEKIPGPKDERKSTSDQKSAIMTSDQKSAIMTSDQKSAIMTSDCHSSSPSSTKSSPLSSPERNLINRSKLVNGNGIRIPEDGVLKDVTWKDGVLKDVASREEISTCSKDLHHYCLSIDIRNIRSINPSFNWTSSPFLIQYSYSFFGPSTKIKTSQVRLVSDEIISFENGFFSFNFVTSEVQLRDTFENIALILELIEVSSCKVSNSSKAIIRGISHVNLLDLVHSESDQHDRRKLLVTKPIITDYSDGKLAQVTVIFSLQDVGRYTGASKSGQSIDTHHNCQYNESDSDSFAPGLNVSKSILESASGSNNQNLNQIMNSSVFNQIDHLFIEAALEIEAWKQSQVRLFKESIKKKEKKIIEKKAQELTLLELQLRESLERVSLKEQLVNETRARIESEALSTQKRMEEEGRRREVELREEGRRREVELREEGRRREVELREELEDLKLELEEKCCKISKLESQNQQLKTKLLTGSHGSSNGHGSISKATGSTSGFGSISKATGSTSGFGSISKATGSRVRGREEADLKKKSESIKSDPKDFVLRSSAPTSTPTSAPTSGFTRNNSLPSSVRSANKLGRTVSNASSKSSETKEQKTVPKRTLSTLSTGSVRWKSSSTTPSATSCLRSSLVQKGTKLTEKSGSSTPAKDRKSVLLEQLKNERNMILKNGLCRSDDPMIKSIEKELKKHGVKPK